MLRSALTVHAGEPDLRNELPGAFAELKLSAVGVNVPGVTAATAAVENAMTAAHGTVRRKRIRRNMSASPYKF
jgi:hypothetical protein